MANTNSEPDLSSWQVMLNDMEHSKKNLEEELQKTEVVSWEGWCWEELLLVGAHCRHPQAFTHTALEDLALAVAPDCRAGNVQ